VNPRTDRIITLGAIAVRPRGDGGTGGVCQGCRQTVLNLAEMPDMDSAGLGELVRTQTRVNRANGSLKLMNVTKRIRDLLVVTKQVTVFETFDSEAEALQSFLVV
jgi:anti-sigma B factor antagonist